MLGSLGVLDSLVNVLIQVILEGTVSLVLKEKLVLLDSMLLALLVLKGIVEDLGKTEKREQQVYLDDLDHLVNEGCQEIMVWQERRE